MDWSHLTGDIRDQPHSHAQRFFSLPASLVDACKLFVEGYILVMGVGGEDHFTVKNILIGLLF